MRIYVRTLYGDEMTLEVEATETIENIKNIIYNITLNLSSVSPIPTNRQVLKFNHSTLLNSHTLTYYGITKDSTIHLLLPTTPEAPVASVVASTVNPKYTGVPWA